MAFVPNRHLETSRGRLVSRTACARALLGPMGAGEPTRRFERSNFPCSIRQLNPQRLASEVLNNLVRQAPSVRRQVEYFGLPGAALSNSLSMHLIRIHRQLALYNTIPNSYGEVISHS